MGYKLIKLVEKPQQQYIETLKPKDCFCLWHNTHYTYILTISRIGEINKILNECFLAIELETGELCRFTKGTAVNKIDNVEIIVNREKGK